MKLIFINRFFYPDLSATSQLLSDLAFALASEGAPVHVITNCYDKRIERLWRREGPKVPTKQPKKGGSG